MNAPLAPLLMSCLMVRCTLSTLPPPVSASASTGSVGTE
jgi:hypothetical protein